MVGDIYLIAEIPQSKEIEDDTTPTNSISSQGSQNALQINLPINNPDSEESDQNPDSEKTGFYPAQSTDTVDGGAVISIEVLCNFMTLKSTL